RCQRKIELQDPWRQRPIDDLELTHWDTASVQQPRGDDWRDIVRPVGGHPYEQPLRAAECTGRDGYGFGVLACFREIASRARPQHLRRRECRPADPQVRHSDTAVIGDGGEADCSREWHL